MPSLTNEIKKSPISTLGYGFVEVELLPEGKDEYYLRNMQIHNGINYRKLTAYEIEALVRNRNTSDDWNNILVSDAFNPELVKNCKFFGLVRIGKLEPYFLDFSDLKVPVGLYNSTIISCDFGDNVVVDNVNYMSHYIIGSEVIIVNVNELVTTSHAKFGNGILKEKEDESVRIWLELCNENGGRKVLPFDGMLAGDAFLWTRYRGDNELLEKFKEFSEKKFDNKRGYYGKIGDRTVIKNCKIVKDVWVGSDAYLKGANKLKNLTINSGPEGKSQIGEGCEMVNGIMGFGCRAFYGVKAVRFMMASHSQLKYGARLINSYLGNNATISCCEVLNSLIFPAHEQHHNNSFLCASLIMGQSNIAAGATIGSNHNSRSADGELIAGRGFWPGLCVSLKHNSIFASFTILAKGDYPSELNIPIPFSLVSNDVTNNQLIIMPGYWFMYNMYALERNAFKYIDRDKRAERIQNIEYNYLAPDSINEIINSLKLFRKYTGKTFLKTQNSTDISSEEETISKGNDLLESNDTVVEELEIIIDCVENSKRKVKILKVVKAYHLFKELVAYYAVNELLKYLKSSKTNFRNSVAEVGNVSKREEWLNVGGQMIPAVEVQSIINDVKTGGVSNWEELHNRYKDLAHDYQKQKLGHALACLKESAGIDLTIASDDTIINLLENAVKTKQWMVEGIYASREKDHTNAFRKMMYDTQEEMDAVVGKFEENTFIKQQNEEQKKFEEAINAITKSFEKEPA